MKLETAKTKVKHGGSNLQSKTFGIKVDAKVFDILSKSLYPNKIKAVVRELCTNAADSMIESGKVNIPFTVKLPTAFDPIFRVSDTGVGMSEEDVDTVYTTYFDSNKTLSNSVDGCLGLGSKSPFAYTDSFSVKAIKNGKINIYQFYIDENGYPDMKKTYSQDTDEENGVTVELSVEPSDIGSFKNEAENVLKWFKVKPIVTGHDLKIEKQEQDLKTIISTDKYRFIDPSIYYDYNNYYYNNRYQEKSYIIMGNVAYPITSKSIINNNDIGNINNDVVKELLDNNGIHIYVNRGDCSITPSREVLSYDKKTVKYLLDTISEIISDLKFDYEKELSKYNSLWEVYSVIEKDKNKSRLHNTILKDVVIKWKNNTINLSKVHSKIDQQICNANHYDFKKCQDDTLRATPVYRADSKIHHLRYDSVYYIWTQSENNGWNKLRQHAIDNKTMSFDIVYPSEIYKKDKQGKVISTGRYVDPNKVKNYLNKKLSIPNDRIVIISDLIYTKPSNPTKANATRKKSYKILKSSSSDWIDIEDTSILDKECVYVDVKFNAWKYSDKEPYSRSVHELNEYKNRLSFILNKDIEIYGVRNNAKTGDLNTIKLKDYYDGVIAKHKDNIKEIYKEFLLSNYDNRNGDLYRMFYDMLLRLKNNDLQELMKDSLIKQFIETCKSIYSFDINNSKYKENIKKLKGSFRHYYLDDVISNIIGDANKGKIDTEIQKIEKNIKDYYSKITSKYIMLTHYDYTSDLRDAKSLDHLFIYMKTFV